MTAQSHKRDLDFWRGPFRAIHTNIRKIDATLDVERYVGWAVDAGANVVMCGGGGIVCFYPTALPYQRVSEFLPPGRDLLGEIVERAHARGLRVLARMDVSKHYRSLYEAHPDWFAHDRTGEPLRVGDGQLYVTCPNGSYRQRCTFEIMGEILDRYPVDGFFFNAFPFQGCECPACRQRFEAEMGRPYPAAGSRDDAAWRAIATFRSGVISELATRVRDFLHARDPHLMTSVDFHLTTDRPAHQRESGFDNLALSDIVDVITVEAHVTLNRPYPQWPYWAGEQCRLARTFRENQPITILLSYFDIQGSRRSGQPPGQVAYDIMQIAANGGQPWVALSGTPEGVGGQDDRRALPALQETYRFLAKHEAYHRDLESAAQVAVIYSRPSFEWLGHQVKQPPERQWVHAYRGCYAALVEDHVPFDVLYHEHIGPHERWTAERLAERYRVLVLPDVFCLSDQDAATLDAYVALGGFLLCTGETGLGDRLGAPRAGAALQSLGVAPVRSRNVRGAYLRVRDAAASGLPRFEDVGVLALNGPFVYTAAAGTLCFIPPVLNNTPEFAFWRPEDETDVPGLIRSRYGNGSAVWLPWLVGESYWLLRHAPYGYLIGDLVRNLLGDLPIETDAPPSVQITLHRQRTDAGGHRFVLHLINGTGRESRALEQVIPLGAIRLRVAAPGVRSARSLVLEKDLECHVAGDGTALAFTLPRLDAYDVVVLE
ncbi:MAG: family 10 glycosylhydrolase [Chloroflexi bacterium]|nr:family 10 glycosylhydrolase [Chloroflexota bacterium]